VTEISEKDSGWAPLAEVKDELERRMAKLEGAAL